MYETTIILTFAAVAFLWIAVLKISKQVEVLKQRIKEIDIPEYRCNRCADQLTCPAAHSGVCYPCEHFKEEDSDERPKL